MIRFDVKSIGKIRTDLDYWHPDGCIVDAVTLGSRYFDPAVYKGLPTVFIDCDPRFLKQQTSCVLPNTEAAVHVAAKELLRHNLPSYAFVAWPGRPFWSESRGLAFLRIMRDEGQEAFVFHPDDHLRNRRSIVNSLSMWLCSQKHPLGILTASDAMSEHVLEAARKAGLTVPDDIMIIGIDDDEFFCEQTRPTLSSVSQGFDRAGEQAVGILAKLFENPKRAPIQEKCESVCLVTRGSTRRSVKHDKAASEALDLIRANAIFGLTASEVLKCFNCSRRLAEQRFKSLAGRSIMDEIHSIQIEQAKKLIANPMTKLTAIPQLCGHRSTPFFLRLFKKQTGLSMSEFRASRTPAI